MKNITQFPKKPIEQILSEGAERIRNDKSIPALERNCLSAILEGNHQEADRLLDIGRKFKNNNMWVVPKSKNTRANDSD